MRLVDEGDGRRYWNDESGICKEKKKKTENKAMFMSREKKSGHSIKNKNTA